MVQEKSQRTLWPSLIDVWTGVEHSVIDDRIDQYVAQTSMLAFELQEDILNFEYALWHSSQKSKR